MTSVLAYQRERGMKRQYPITNVEESTERTSESAGSWSSWWGVDQEVRSNHSLDPQRIEVVFSGSNIHHPEDNNGAGHFLQVNNIGVGMVSPPRPPRPSGDHNHNRTSCCTAGDESAWARPAVEKQPSTDERLWWWDRPGPTRRLLKATALVAAVVFVLAVRSILAGHHSHLLGGDRSVAADASTATTTKAGVVDGPSAAPQPPLMVVEFAEPTSFDVPTSPTATPARTYPLYDDETIATNSPTTVASKEPTLDPTIPRPSPGPSPAPTTAAPTTTAEEPTRAPLAWYTTATNTPIQPPPTPPAPGVQFRLKLHWEPDFFWQESERERFYCIACAGCEELNFSDDPDDLCRSSRDCEAGDQLWIRDCIDGYGAAFQVHSHSDGDTLRLSDSNACVTWVDPSYPYIHLEPCAAANHLRQTFQRIATDGSPFTLSPVYFSNQREYCLTQDHHPKSREILGLQTCNEALYFNTGKWGLYPLAEEND